MVDKLSQGAFQPSVSLTLPLRFDSECRYMGSIALGNRCRICGGLLGNRLYELNAKIAANPDGYHPFL